jgi:hypothetical protein
MLKEKKKLLTKIDNLKRKVQSLQSKLAIDAGLKSSEPDPVEHVNAKTVEHPKNASTSIQTPAPQTPRIPESIAPTPPTRPPATRAVSGPSALPVPKSPGKKTVIPLATTETKPVATAISDLQPSNSSASKKRKIPDDYEERTPPVQGFSTDCLPVNDVNITPRRRLPRNSSGFTPVRNRVLAVPPTGNPRIPLSASSFTNSPQARLPTHDPLAKPTKRTWLGKIKGVTRQAAVAATHPSYEKRHDDLL